MTDFSTLTHATVVDIDLIDQVSQDVSGRLSSKQRCYLLWL